MYVMVCLHLDLAYAVRVVSKYMGKPDMEHWKVV